MWYFYFLLLTSNTKVRLLKIAHLVFLLPTSYLLHESKNAQDCSSCIFTSYFLHESEIAQDLVLLFWTKCQINRRLRASCILLLNVCVGHNLYQDTKFTHVKIPNSCLWINHPIIVKDLPWNVNWRFLGEFDFTSSRGERGGGAVEDLLLHLIRVCFQYFINIAGLIWSCFFLQIWIIHLSRILFIKVCPIGLHSIGFWY